MTIWAVVPVYLDTQAEAVKNLVSMENKIS